MIEFLKAFGGELDFLATQFIRRLGEEFLPIVTDYHVVMTFVTAWALSYTFQVLIVHYKPDWCKKTTGRWMAIKSLVDIVAATISVAVYHDFFSIASMISIVILAGPIWRIVVLFLPRRIRSKLNPVDYPQIE